MSTVTPVAPGGDVTDGLLADFFGDDLDALELDTFPNRRHLLPPSSRALKCLSLEFAAGRRRPYDNRFRLLLIAPVAYALISSSGLVVTWNLGPVTMSIAPPVVRRSLSLIAGKLKKSRTAGAAGR
jgi:hypothetical protein